MSKAAHPTVLVFPGAVQCRVKESVDEVIGLVAEGSWFQATADPEGESIWVNAQQVLYVARERTPIEVMRAERCV